MNIKRLNDSYQDRVIYLIDGVSVSRSSWERNQFWEPESDFQIVYVRSQKGLGNL